MCKIPYISCSKTHAIGQVLISSNCKLFEYFQNSNIIEVCKYIDPSDRSKEFSLATILVPDDSQMSVFVIKKEEDCDSNKDDLTKWRTDNYNE